MGIRCIRLILLGCLAAMSFANLAQAQEVRIKQESKKQETTESKSAETASEDKQEEKDNDKIVVKTKKGSEFYLPADTRLWVALPDATQLVGDLNDTQFGELAAEESVKPFVEKISKQIKDLLDKNNVELGIKTEDLGEIHSGEICLAAVKQDGDKADFGFVMLVDVEETKVEAKDLFARIEKELKAQKAKKEEIELAGEKAIKWSYPKVKGMRKQKFAYQIIVDRWMILSDNEQLIEDTIGRVKKSDGHIGSLGDSEIFKTVRKNCQLPEKMKQSQAKWFIEPFGYYDILREIAENNAKQDPTLQKRFNDYGKIFRESGFNVIKGFGGNLVVTEEKQIFYRSYLHAESNSGTADRKYKGAAEILRFENERKHSLQPEDFVSAKSSGYFTISWDMSKAFDNISPIANAIMGGTSFDSVIEEIKVAPNGPRVDLKEMIGLLDDRVTVFTDNTHPIDEGSEKVVVAVKVRDKIDEVFDMLKRVVYTADLKEIDFEGHKIIIDEQPEDDGIDPDWPDIDDIDIDGKSSDESEDDDEDPKPAKPIFDKRIYASVGGYILMSNDLDYMKTLIKNTKNKEKQNLSEARDFIEVNRMLGAHVDEKRISYRQFIRLDESIRVNYEMLRQGKMGSSNTVLARVLNGILTPKDAAEDEVRKQKIDGSDLPADFDKQIAPFLGTAGFILETVDTGWVLSGAILPKKNRPNVASKEKEGSQRE